MGVDGISTINAVSASSMAYTKDSSSQPAQVKEEDVFGDAAVYEKSSDSETVKQTRTDADRAAIIQQLKADAEARQNSLMEIVKKTIQGQGSTFAISSSDDMWKFLASGKFTVDADTKAQAQKDISDDGYWGVEKTSDRIVDFAKALSGDDTKNADKMIDAFKKGFKEATAAWGKSLPDISKKTYDAVIKKLNDWKNSGDQSQNKNKDEIGK
jgi:hypothetical protein